MEQNDRTENACIRRIREKFEGHVPVYPERRLPETSAVLIPLVEKDGELMLLYEQRARNLDSQPGEVCFPGGRTEGNESERETAVRETCEELLVDRGQIEILGAADGIMGPAGAPVWPYIGVLHGYRDTWSRDEVDHTFYIPVKWFEENGPEIYRTKMITVPGDDFPYELIPGGRNYKWREKIHEVYFYRHPDAVIWGLTAHITASFIRCISRNDL